MMVHESCPFTLPNSGIAHLFRVFGRDKTDKQTKNQPRSPPSYTQYNDELWS